MKKATGYLAILILSALAIGCKGDADDVIPQPPTDLSATVEVSGAQNGFVVVNASAKKANFYKFYFRETEDEVPVVNTEGKASHTYSKPGTYLIKVQAHTTDDVFISIEKEVEIILANGGENDIPASGYSTPNVYEGMALVWSDEFEGTELNSENWSYEIGTGNNGWGNNELEYYRQENTTIREGCLVIEARKENFGGRQYTSSRIVTRGKRAFRYGRIDIRAVLPQGQGIWPALWMLGSNFGSVGWPACGEIDIMEMIGGSGRENTVHGTVHWDNNGSYANYGKSYKLASGKFSDEFHVFTIKWTASAIEWYVDDVKYNAIDISPDGLSEFRNNFFFIFNIAVGGNWPGNPDATTTFPQRMAVDYVRVFQAD